MMRLILNYKAVSTILVVSAIVITLLFWIKSGVDASTETYNGPCKAVGLVDAGSDVIQLRVDCKGKKATQSQKGWIIKVKPGTTLNCALHADGTAVCNPPKKPTKQ